MNNMLQSAILRAEGGNNTGMEMRNSGITAGWRSFFYICGR